MLDSIPEITCQMKNLIFLKFFTFHNETKTKTPKVEGLIRQEKEGFTWKTVGRARTLNTEILTP